MSPLNDDIHSRARRASLPWGGEGAVISTADVLSLAASHSLPGHTVEAEALKLSVIPLRYQRNMQSITPEHQIRLLEATVAQVGLGGLGGTLLEQFLRAGVGTIRGADGDHFEDSNLNRQALSETTVIEQAKAHAAQKRAAIINPSTSLITRNEFLSPETLPEFLRGADVAVDALGGLSMRPHLQRAAAEAGIPLVTGALAGWTGYVGVVMPGDIGPSDLMGTDNAAEESLGCPAPAVGFIASLMATEVLRLISKGTSPLAGKMSVIDLDSLSFEIIALN